MEADLDAKNGKKRAGGSFAIMDAIQSPQLQVYALWIEVGEIQKSHIQQPQRVSNLNTVQLTSNKFKNYL